MMDTESKIVQEKKDGENNVQDQDVIKNSNLLVRQVPNLNLIF